MSISWLIVFRSIRMHFSFHFMIFIREHADETKKKKQNSKPNNYLVMHITLVLEHRNCSYKFAVKTKIGMFIHI